jgi:hypothetical protein
MQNAMSQPVLVSHVCEVHGERIIAPVTYDAVCRCGRRCEIDVPRWLAEMHDRYPDESLEQLSAEAGIAWSQVQEVLNQTEES